MFLHGNFSGHKMSNCEELFHSSWTENGRMISMAKFKLNLSKVGIQMPPPTFMHLHYTILTAFYSVESIDFNVVENIEAIRGAAGGPNGTFDII